jgi:hypothetical protein
VSFLAPITTFVLIFPLLLLDKTVVAARALATGLPLKIVREGEPAFSLTGTLVVER